MIIPIQSLMKIYYAVVITATLVLSPPLSAEENMADLILEVNGFKSSGGFAMIALFTSEDDYENDGEAFRKARVSVENKSVVLTFRDLPHGQYAIKMYYDENNNGELDTSLFGIPREGVGFSNNARPKMGPPSFEKTRFEIDRGIVRQTIWLKYM